MGQLGVFCMHWTPVTGSHPAMIAEGVPRAKVPLDFGGLCRQSVGNFAAIRFFFVSVTTPQEGPQ